MSHPCSTNIVINSAHFLGHQRLTRSILANSPVLDSLLPQLSVWQNERPKRQQQLENVDPYMLLETEQLLERVGKLCMQLGLPDSSVFSIKLAKSKMRISGLFEHKAQLSELIFQDPWIGGAFDWLHGNYKALAHSQELVSFSQAYEKNRHEAVEEYRHFEYINQGMDCYVSCSLEQGKANLSWLVESPVHSYHLRS